jgi:hypothetical protein
VDIFVGVDKIKSEIAVEIIKFRSVSNLKYTASFTFPALQKSYPATG